MHKHIFYSLGVLKKIIDAATVETTARTLCQMGDNLIEEETSKVYKKEKELKKGKLRFENKLSAFLWKFCLSKADCICTFNLQMVLSLMGLSLLYHQVLLFQHVSR